MMAASLRDLAWDDVTEYTPAMGTVITMPLTFSIADGIALGFISFAAIKLLAGRAGEVKPAMAVLAILFLLKFAWVG
jgi:AGZA family xanthine/uracil permease-like MFS transporter